MKNRWNRLCESRPGLTLIEVIAATALLGTLLTLLMLAHAGQLRQARQAELRLEAIEAADSLLRSWHEQDRLIPRRGQGHVRGTDFTWRTIGRRDPAATRLGLLIVRLELHRADHPDEEPACSVDLPVPIEKGQR